MGKKIKIVFLAAIVFFIILVPVYSYFWDQLSNDDGLSQNSVKSIVQDSLGRMWFGTQDGLNRYDSVELKTYYEANITRDGDFTNAEVSSLCFTESGMLYAVINNKNLISYNAETGVFFNHYNSEFGSIKKILSVSGNAVLILTQAKLWIFDGNDFMEIAVAFNSEFFDMRIGDADEFSVVSESGEIAVFKVNKDLHVYSKMVKKSFFSLPCYYCPFGNSYFLVSVDGKVYYEYKNEVITELPLVGNIRVSDCLEGPDGMLWISTLGSGIYLVDPETGTYRHESVQTGLFDNYIISLYTDNAGRVWAGSWSSGVALYDPFLKFFKHYSPDNFGLDSADVMAVTEADDGSLWLGTLGSGIIILDKEGIIERLGTETGLLSDYCLSLDKDENGRMWAGTPASGVMVIDSLTHQLLSYYNAEEPSDRRIISNQVYDTLVLKDGSCIVAGRESSAYSGGINIISSEGNVELIITGPTVWAVEYCGERILLATEKGLKEYLPGSNVLHDVEVSSEYFYSEKRVWSLHAIDSDRVYAGTTQGVYEIQLLTGEVSHWSTANGLPNNVVYAVENDSDGNLWVSSNKGISRINPENNQVLNFNLVNGLQNLEFNLNSIYKTSDGELVFGGINGINKFLPESFDIKTSPLKAFIGEIRLYNVPIIPAQTFNNRIIIDTTVEMIERLELKYDENNIMLQMRASNYHNPENTIYRYRLSGFDENLDESEWVYSGNKNYASYTNLDPGKYQFQYQAASGLNEWSDQYSSLELVISPSFVQTALFRIIVIVLILLIIFIVLLYITKLFKEVEHRKAVEKQLNNNLEEKDLLLKEVHHRVKNNLAIIISLLNLQEGAIKNRQDGLDAFDKTRGRIYSMSFVHEQLYLNDSVSTIDMYSYIQGLKVHILNTFFVPEEVEVITEVEDAVLDINQAIPCGLIINELLTNAAKHAFPNGGPGRIRIGFRKTSEAEFCLYVTDTGVGLPDIKQKVETTSIGMTIVESLVIQINGVLSINSDNGTTVEVVFPSDYL